MVRKNGSIRQVAMAMLLVLALMVFAGGTIAAGTLVDEKATVDLMPTMHAPAGASGEAELRLRIDADEHRFRAKATAEGLVEGVTYSLWVGGYFIASDVADDQGRVSFDAEPDIAAITTLLGLKVKVREGTSMDGTKVLFGKVVELERDVELEEEGDSVLSLG